MYYVSAERYIHSVKRNDRDSSSVSLADHKIFDKLPMGESFRQLSEYLHTIVNWHLKDIIHIYFQRKTMLLIYKHSTSRLKNSPEIHIWDRLCVKEKGNTKKIGRNVELKRGLATFRVINACRQKKRFEKKPHQV